MVSLSLNNLSKDYRCGNETVSVLKGISIDFPNTGIVGLLGKNGAGKTTLIKSCVNLITYGGRISYFEQDLQYIQKTNSHTQYYTALFEGNRNIYWKLTPLENIQYFAGLRGMKYSIIKDYALELLNVLELGHKSHSLVESLSRGMQQKVALALALSFNTPIVFLDEPTLGLDIETRNSLIEFLQENDHIKKQLIIVSSHDLDFITSVCNNIYILKSGTIYEYNADLLQPIYRIKSKKRLSQIKNFQCNKLKDGCFYYDINDDIAKVIAMLSNEEKMNVVSVINLKYDLESFYNKTFI